MNLSRTSKQTLLLRKGFRLFLVPLTGVLLCSAWLDPRCFPLSLAGISLLVSLGLFRPPRAAFASGLFAGWIAGLIGFHWIPQSFVDSTGLPLLAGLTAYVLLTLFESLRFALFALLVSTLNQLSVETLLSQHDSSDQRERILASQRQPAWAGGPNALRKSPHWLFLVPLFWVALEYMLPTFFPWTLGATPTHFIVGQQLAELSGMRAVSLLYVAAATIPVVVYAGWRSADRKADDENVWLRSHGGAANSLWILVLFVTASLIFGIWRIQTLEGQPPGTTDLRVALLQVDPTWAGKERVLQEMSRTVENDVDLICWPETSIGNYQTDLENFRDPIAICQKSRHPMLGFQPLPNPAAFLLAGGRTYRTDAGQSGPYRVTAFLVNKREQIAARHDKRLLIPIGEYVPFQKRFPQLRELVSLDEINEPGDRIVPMRMNEDVSLGISICFEDMNADHSRQMTRHGATLLVALVNGTAFENPLALQQHMHLAQGRAIENRRWFVRCSATGVTCVISPTGRVVQQLPCGSEECLIADVSCSNEITVFAAYGDWVGPLCLAVTILFVTALLFGKRSSAKIGGNDPDDPHDS